VPFQPGEEPDIDIIEEAEEVAAAAELAPPIADAEPARPQPAVALARTDGEGEAEDDISFRDAMEMMAVPDRDERESEDYGEEEEDDGEEYEVPTVVVAENRPTAIRFAEDLLPKREEAEDASKKPATARKRRRVEDEEDEMDDIEYTGRIH
jgi:hypothetical protein